MDMKLEGVSDLYFILAVLVPGFIYNGVLGHFVPLYQNTEKSLIVLRLLTATAFNYALCSPLIYLLAEDTFFRSMRCSRVSLGSSSSSSCRCCLDS